MDFFDFHHHKKENKSGIYNLSFREEVPDFNFSAGIHPKDINDNLENYFLWLKDISIVENCIAIGECGLDGLISVDEKLQEEVFERQIILANHLKNL